MRCAALRLQAKIWANRARIIIPCDQERPAGYHSLGHSCIAMSEDGDSEDDNKVVLDELIGMKDEWLQLEAEIRTKASSLQSELTQQRKVSKVQLYSL